MTALAVLGCGYVGAVSAACFASLGHRVSCIDIDEERIALLRRGISPVHEPDLEELIREGLSRGLLTFNSQYPEFVDAEVVFVAVNTPGSFAGPADLRSVRDAVTQIVPRVRPGTVLVNKSTVPIGTGELVDGIALRAGREHFPVVSNPEFLREGSAVADFLHPDRIVLGSNSATAVARVAALYKDFGAPIQVVDIRTAEMIKYASNAFLATKISFINEIAEICEALGADVLEVARGMGLDTRIGPQFLRPGIGWGGSCFPKDVRALAHMASVHGAHPQLLRSVIEINNDQRLRIVQKAREALGGLEERRILVLGAAFKADTDDTRNSPPLEIANLLLLEGAEVVIHDPVVDAGRIRSAVPGAAVASDAVEGARDCDAIVIATDWPQFAALPLDAVSRIMRGRLIIDGRNLLDPLAVRAAGFEYRCVGRPSFEGPAMSMPLAAAAAGGAS